MKCVVAKSVPQLLLPKKKEHHAAVANDLIQTATTEPDFLKKVVTLKGTEALLSYVQMFLVSCVFFSKHLYFSYYMAGYFLDRPYIYVYILSFDVFTMIMQYFVRKLLNYLYIGEEYKK